MRWARSASSRPGPCSSPKPSGRDNALHRLVSVLLRRPGRPALPPGAGGPPATVRPTLRRVAAGQEPAQATRTWARPSGFGSPSSPRSTARASASPFVLAVHPQRPGGRAPELARRLPGARRRRAAHRLGRGEDLPPASRRPARGAAVAAAPAEDPGTQVRTRGPRARAMRLERSPPPLTEAGANRDSRTNNEPFCTPPHTRTLCQNIC